MTLFMLRESIYFENGIRLYVCFLGGGKAVCMDGGLFYNEVKIKRFLKYLKNARQIMCSCVWF